MKKHRAEEQVVNPVGMAQFTAKKERALRRAGMNGHRARRGAREIAAMLGVSWAVERVVEDPRVIGAASPGRAV